MDDDRALIAELTEIALTQASPDELAVFEETAHEYFADPQGTLAQANKGQAVGFGLELAMITPVALAVGTALVQALISIVSERTLAAGGRVVAGHVRRLLRREQTDARIVLTAEEAGRLRQIALTQGRALGLPEAQAALLAESFIGALWSAG